MNNKGFTMVELLATLVILSILAVLGLIAYMKYLDYAREKAYDTMAQSAANAASEYSMDHIGISTVTFAQLDDGDYLETPVDPANEENTCKGKVLISNEEDVGLTSPKGIKSIESYVYDVTVCCYNYSYVYRFPGGKKVEDKEACK